MYFLSLETSTKTFSLSVSRDDKVLRFRNLKTTKLLENSIITAIDKLLASAKVKFNQLDAFAIGLGPGSFTSLRVGLSTVKAFCMATQKPVVGICSLDVIAAATDGREYDQICVFNDARRGNVYAAIYVGGKCQSGHLLTTPAQVLDMVQGKTLFIGDALPLYRKDIESAYKVHAKAKGKACQAFFADEQMWQPQAAVLADLAYDRLKKNDTDDASKLLPIYLYPEDCQVRK